jgi:uncharacterized protein (TIGR00255 family)
MRSMTGFGQATGSNGRHAVTVTLRGVNHKFLEVRLKLGDDYRDAEAPLRELLEGELVRGRVEAGVEVAALTPRQAAVHVERGVVQAAHAALVELVEAGLIAEGLTAGDLLRVPEALSVRLAPDTWEATDQELLLAVAGRALGELVAARSTEGEKTRQALADRLASLAEVAARLGGLRERARDELAEGLRQRLAELLGDRRLDEGRLAQEVAMLVDRSDVAEELERLAAHLDHFAALLDQPGAVGRRLDFLAQEIFRELNTLGAKSRDAGMIRAVLDAKGLCEQLREQVQNVE